MENHCRRKVPGPGNHLQRHEEAVVGRLIAREPLSRENSSTTLFATQISAMDRLCVRNQVSQTVFAAPADIPHITAVSRLHAGRIM
ncbi:hypothetical protein DCAR_0208792 [Daucus carota subsp. sativus]|uniref:Uncharacterized protein n=1 Tax=Daucus carota subsp. sativus TaxID=79200 RepID=A0A166ET99_DAUCS|nr:hypothetical protein DCAR_0208792 [Daucus carota subsp. sativus]